MDFEIIILGHIGCSPVFVRGQQPISDMLAVAHRGPGQIYYFYYSNIDDYNSGYWAAFRQIVQEHHPNIAYHLATSDYIDDALGMSGDNIPPLWILSLECRGTRQYC